MSVSSFQPLNPRQLDLQRRLLVANELRETSLIEQLELQWVHRYGMTSLPTRKAELCPEALPPTKSSKLESSIQHLSLVSDQPFETEARALQVAPPLPSDSKVDDSKEVAAGVIEDLADRSSNPPLAVAPPPIALGAQRFRRWMVASSAVQDLQAS